MRSAASFNIALVLLLVLSAVSISAITEASETLRINVGFTPPNLNPILTTTVDRSFLGRLLDDLLIATDAGGAMVPMLARDVPSPANGGISQTGLRVPYHLRSGVHWQDGMPFTSRDIVHMARQL